MKRKKRYVKLRIEKVMKIFICICFCGILITSFIGQAMLQSHNSKLQRLKSQIDTQEEINASIQMKINELASLDNALEVAKNDGLEYNNNNIRVIPEE